MTPDRIIREAQRSGEPRRLHAVALRYGLPWLSLQRIVKTLDNGDGYGYGSGDGDGYGSGDGDGYGSG